jgi:AraC-like DNA-binding protein/ligand-binding sensor protein
LRFHRKKPGFPLQFLGWGISAKSPTPAGFPLQSLVRPRFLHFVQLNTMQWSQMQWPWPGGLVLQKKRRCVIINDVIFSPEFDIEAAKRIANDYKTATTVDCFIIDLDGRYLFSTNENNGVCAFCKTYQTLSGKPDTCLNSHLYGSYQAERFGGKYIYFCPIGFIHWASPILKDDMMKGAILGGPILMIDREEYFEEEFLKKIYSSSQNIALLRRQLENVPYKTPEEVSSLAEILFILSTFVSGINASEFVAEREQMSQQSNISDYIQRLKTLGGEEERSAEYPIDKERELLRLIPQGDKKGSQKILNEILGYVFFSSGGKIDIIKARVLELVVLLSRAAMEGGADAEQIFGLNYNYLNQVHKFKTIEDISYWLSRIMLRFTDLVFNLQDVKHVDVIYKAVDYIKRNYMKKISLTEVANFVALSPSYFSKLFKDETNCNFNQFLNQVRIERSKTALLDNSVPLVDVAFLMGFEDQSYFTKVFKKITGTSPGKYRETRGKIPVKIRKGA